MFNGLLFVANRANQAFAKHLCVANDAGQWGLQFVGYSRNEVRLGLVKLGQLSVGSFQFLIAKLQVTVRCIHRRQMQLRSEMQSKVKIQNESRKPAQTFSVSSAAQLSASSDAASPVDVELFA